jgi:GcrA cell cycle regulator
MAFDWSESAVYNLKAHWKDGLSAAQIAKQLAPQGGLSRNAVIGKVHRIGLAQRACPSRPRIPRQRRQQIAPEMLAQRQTMYVKAAPIVRTGGPGLEALSARGDAAVLSLDADQCKYPIGDPKHADFGFCARTCSGVYCGAHRGLLYQPSRAVLGRPRGT